MTELDMEILCALNHSKSITKIAETFYLTQPSVTREIQNLEQELQIQILHRTNKGVTLTPQGTYFAKQAEHILDIINRSKLTAQTIDNNDAGHLRIASANSYSQFILPGLLQKYTAMYPNITFDINTTMSNNVIKMVQGGKVDFGIVRGDFSFHAVKKLISVDECYLFASSPFELEDLPRMSRIAYPLSPSSQTLFDDWWFEYFSHPPNVGFNVSSLSISYEMVRKGLGYSILLTQGIDLKKDDMMMLPMIRKDGTAVSRNTWFICNDEEGLSPAAKRFVELLFG